MTGSPIALFSSNYDPDVLVWDTRSRLMSYVTDTYHLAKLLLPHALLARAGTFAVVTTCRPKVVHPKYLPIAIDAVGIRMTSGQYRGRYGWVMMEDVHVMGDRATQRRHP
jgi:hypothetical protein